MPRLCRRQIFINSDFFIHSCVHTLCAARADIDVFVGVFKSTATTAGIYEIHL